MEIFDTHAHYDDEAFAPDRDALLTHLPGTGVSGVISSGTSAATSRLNAQLAARYDYVYFTAGIHPEECEAAGENDLEEIKALLTGSKKAVAVGEIGLDYHWPIDRETQRIFFEKQLALANTLGLPAVIHDREAHADTLALLQKYKPRGTLHCFAGSAEMAREILKLGLYIGFTGNVTFKNNKKAPKVAEVVPLDRILVETDCPYMAPVPCRGRRCDSSMIAHTLEWIAAVKGVTAQALSQITAANARRLFNIPENGGGI